MKLNCVKCGKISRIDRPTMVNLIIKFGGYGTLESNYMCKKCRPKVILSDVRKKS